MDWFVDCDRTIAALVSRFFHHRDRGGDLGGDGVGCVLSGWVHVHRG